jgi:hypothetical protein
MKLHRFSVILFLHIYEAACDITNSWITTKCYGYDGIPANVLMVTVTNSQVQIAASSMPCYLIGPWNDNISTMPNGAIVNITFSR